MTHIKLALIQMSMDNDILDNREKAFRMVEDAAKKADIVCLPELFTTPYFCRERKCGKDYSEMIPGPTSNALSKLAEELEIVLVAGSIYERTSSGKNFNTSLTYGTQGELLCKYRKIHIPQDEGFFEKDYFAPGDLGFQVADAGTCRISPQICYDQWFPEAARTSALMGSELIVYPTAIANVKGVGEQDGNWHDAWETVMRGSAIANAIPIAAVNRVGTEGISEFWGGSFVCDGFGKILAKAGNKEEIITASVDLEHGKRIREGWMFFQNRRPEQYGKLTEKK